MERALSVLYAGGWAARLWALVPGATRVRLIEHSIVLPGREKGRPPLPPPHDDVAVVGLDDPLTSRRIADKIALQEGVDAALARVADAPIKIALCHSPDGYPEVKGRGVQLLLCGHTHGGHIALPGHRPLWIPGPHGRLWPYRRHEVDGLTVFVSRGVGGSLVPMRTYAPPDVALITIDRAP